MKTNKILTITMAIAIAITFLSCSKGEQGTPGINGTNGVANISTNIYTINTGQWINGGLPVWSYTVSDDAITNSNTDAVEVYFSTDNAGDWAGMPFSNAFYTGDELIYDYGNNGVSSNVLINYLYNSAPPQTIYIKVVTIPPSIMVKYPNTNWHNYSQVQAIIESQNVKSN